MANDKTAVEQLRSYSAEAAIILGSGLSSLVVDAKSQKSIPYADFPGIRQPSVPGHAGRFVLGEIGTTRLILAQGRVHLYEGFSAREVTAVVRVLAEAGIKRLIVTDAAGALDPRFKPGDWMIITDHINLTGTSPLLGSAEFVDLSDVYSPRLRKNFQRAAHKIDIVLHEGVYASVLGPQYDTPVEARMLRKLGADAIGMSTVLEVIQARALGLEVAGFSCLTNLAAGISKEKLIHDELLQIGKAAAASLSRLLEAFLAKG